MSDYLLVGFLGFCAGLIIGWLAYDRPRTRTRVHRRVRHTVRPNPPDDLADYFNRQPRNSASFPSLLGSKQDTELSELRKIAGLE